MSKRHYHVVVNTPGYLPESDPITVRTRREAEAAAVWEARDLREIGYQVHGSARANTLTAELSPTDLGYVIDIIGPCTDTACEERSWGQG